MDADRLFELDARVERLFWLPGTVILEDGVPREFEEFCESLPEKLDAEIYQDLPQLKQFAGEENEYPERDAVADVLRNVGGFIVQAATPVRRPMKGSKTAYMSGWGHYHTGWLYAKSESDIAAKIETWATDIHARDMKAKAA